MTASTPTELDALRDLHRPDKAGLRVEARRLLANGLTPADVAHALRVAESLVRQWQTEPEGGL